MLENTQLQVTSQSEFERAMESVYRLLLEILSKFRFWYLANLSEWVNFYPPFWWFQME